MRSTKTGIRQWIPIPFCLLFGSFGIGGIHGRGVLPSTFGYRILGVVLFWITGTRAMLFFFPNVFENFVIVCLILLGCPKEEVEPEPDAKSTHAKRSHRSENDPGIFSAFFGLSAVGNLQLGSWLGFQGTALYLINLFLWGTLLYVIPITAFSLYIREPNIPE